MHPPLEDFFQTLALYDTIRKIAFSGGLVVALLLLAYIFFPKFR